MSDIVERLRTDVLWHQRRGNETIAADCREAAAEITRLRADLATSMETLAKAQALQAEMLKERAALTQPAAAPDAATIRAQALEDAAKVCDVTPPYPFRPSIEAAHAIRKLAAAPQAPQPGAQDA